MKFSSKHISFLLFTIFVIIAVYVSIRIYITFRLIEETYTSHRITYDLEFGSAFTGVLLVVMILAGIGAFAQLYRSKLTNETLIIKEYKYDNKEEVIIEQEPQIETINSQYIENTYNAYLQRLTTSVKNKANSLAKLDLCFYTLCETLKTSAAVLYLLDKSKINPKYHWNRQFALEKPKDPPSFEVGEGVIGQTASDAEMRKLWSIPQDQFEISSGLGNKGPVDIILVPLIQNDIVFAVIEFGFLKNINDLEMHLIQKVADHFQEYIYEALYVNQKEVISKDNTIKNE